MKNDVVIVANSPGELSALVKPVAEKLIGHRVVLVLTPCQYTSGKELDYVKTIKNISFIITANQYKNWILRNLRPETTFSRKGAVLFLGGDLAHAVLVAKKLKYPAYAYVQDYIGWYGFYKKFFVPDQQSYNKFGRAKPKLKITGNLMVDSVADIPKWNPEKDVITFLPGSRKWQITHTTPIYETIMAEIRAQLPEAIFQVVSSPFEKAIEIRGAKTIAFEQVYNSEIVMTIPGTNTARLAALGMPMVVVFPLDNPDVIPLEGLLHFITKIPYFGSKLKKFFIETVNKKTKFFSLPNIKANKEIVQEIRGKINPKQVADEVIKLINDDNRRRQMSKELINAMGILGAANNIAEEINEALR